MAQPMPALLEKLIATPAVRRLVHKYSERFREASGYRKYGTFTASTV